MPIHDWTRVRANRFHAFHQDWTIEIARALNRGLLPDGFFALPEQVTGGPSPDVVTLSVPRNPTPGVGGVATAAVPLRMRHVTPNVKMSYPTQANRVTVNHPDGQVVAVIEIVSPGNKGSRHAINSFTRKAAQFLRAGVHLLIVDLFPPSKRDPQGIHPLIWERIEGVDEDFAVPPGQPLTLAAYSTDGAGDITGYIEPLGVGDVMIDMPIFLSPDRYVPCPLESTYMASWDVFPAMLREPLLAPPASPPAPQS